MALFLILLSTVAATVPMLAMLWLVWYLDRYDREPLWLVGTSFAWGATGSIVLAVFVSMIFQLPLLLISPTAASAAGAMFIAPLVEEPSKALILLLIAQSRHFDNMTDGFVYGAAAGLGFGMSENFLYFFAASIEGDALTWMGTVFARTLFTAVMHACASSMVGAALGWAAFRGWGARLVALPVGLGLAMGMHGLWNGLLTIDAILQVGVFALMDFVIFPLELGALFFIFEACIWEETRTIRRELREEAAAGTLPADHVPVLASWWQRRTRWWLPRGVDHHAYVRAATSLALRRAQARATTDAWYAREADQLRSEVRGLLRGA